MKLWIDLLRVSMQPVVPQDAVDPQRDDGEKEVKTKAAVQLFVRLKRQRVPDDPQLRPDQADLLVEVLLGELNLPPEPHRPVVGVEPVDA
ncbi:hypothetical protein [Streptomyces scabichelini]|uniref:hypothetical protein n=1 Tax=Streptomyces scabichelini TaxID=2711217 RepID=UPI001F49EEA0|nr:hypothetical protein [Streptomyces scabichelini]